MAYYPVFLELKGKTALVVGGGAVAQRKIETLIDYGAKIHIVSRDLTHKLKEMVEFSRIKNLGEEFRKEYLDGVFLVIAATSDSRLNRKISAIAQKRGLLVNAVDQPADCNFIVPSIVKRGGLVIAVSTSGKSPAFSKRLRKELENRFGMEYAVFLDLMGRLRKEVTSLNLSQEENSRIFNEIVESDILASISGDKWGLVGSELDRILPEDIPVSRILSDVRNKRGV